MIQHQTEERRPAAPARAPTPRRLVRFLKSGQFPTHPGSYPVASMEQSLAKLGVGYKPAPTSAPMTLAIRVVAKLGLARALLRVSRTAYLVLAGQVSENRYCPASYLHEVIPYHYDAWPNLWNKFERVLRRHRVKVAFFTARQAAEHFREKLGLDAIWMPEACDPAWYRSDKRLADRSIDVLELGRKFDHYHDAIAPHLAARGRTHLFEKVKGQIIFPTREEMIEGYADAKISVCFPSSMTHPARSGNVETVTHRYFESMASKCLIVGHCPSELSDVFGYDPVVRADMDDPAAQLNQILDRIGNYEDLVERNYRRLLEVGTWDVRMKSLVDELLARGYTI